MTSIGDHAFYKCTSLTSVTIPNTVTSIGNFAFYGCEQIKKVIIENRETELVLGSNSFRPLFSDCPLDEVFIGGKLSYNNDCPPFYSNTSLRKVTITGKGAEISENEFSGCTNLQDVIIGDNVTTIGDYAFWGCCSLASINIPESVTSIGERAFLNCTGLTSITIGNSVTSIGNYAFYYCIGLTSISIPNSVTTIGDYAFSGCKGLKIFNFGTQVQTIGQKAFSGCTAMETITSKAEIPPVCGSQALNDINKSECTLLVPDGSLALYQAADQWKEFFFMEIDPDGIKSLTPTLSQGEGEWYDLSGRKIVNSKLSNGKLPRGINIIRHDDGTTRKVLVK